MSQGLVVLEYHHRHGHDTYVCATEQDVARQMASVMLENLSDINVTEEQAKTIALTIADGKYNGLAELWEEWTNGDEYFTLESNQLLEDVEAPEVDMVRLFGPEVV
jgi:hypothetical protein